MGPSSEPPPPGAGLARTRSHLDADCSAHRYAFNAWIPLITYNTTYAPRFLAGNVTTVALIVCAASTLTLAVLLQQRDAAPDKSDLLRARSDDGLEAEDVVLETSDGKHSGV